MNKEMSYEEKLKEELELVRCDLHNTYNWLESERQENKQLKEEIKKLQRIVISKQEDYLIISVGKVTKIFKLNDNKKWINEVGDNNE